MADVEHAMQLIDQTLTAIVPRCHQCNTVLRRHGPSLDFCGDLCQTAWHANRAAGLTYAESPLRRAPAPRPIYAALAEEWTDLDRQASELLYGSWDPPGPFESLWILITRRWRKR